MKKSNIDTNKEKEPKFGLREFEMLMDILKTSKTKKVEVEMDKDGILRMKTDDIEVGLF